MNHFLIVVSADRDKDLGTTNHLKKILEAAGKTTELHVSKADRYGNYTPIKDISDGTDCVIVLGGDGTFIAAARDVSSHGIPMLGINLGRLGFLTDVEVSQIEFAVRKIVAGEYTIEERMMLCGKTFKENGAIKGESRALNDIVIHNSTCLKISEYLLEVDGKELGTYLADGLIVCTPTGSTAYSMSAGGPIIEPTARMVVVTPVCPHTLNTRSIVLSPDSNIKIIAKSVENTVVFDGHNPVNADRYDYVTVRPSRKVTRIVRIGQGSFLSVLSKKFNS